MIVTTSLNKESEAYTMKKEFTLVELMVVIGIIAILAGILLPVLNKSRDKAIQTECAGNLGQLAKAEFAYSADNDQKFLGGVPEINKVNVKKETLDKTWVVGIYDYVKETKTFLCGADENDESSKQDSFSKTSIGKDIIVSYLNNAGLWANKKRYLCERPTKVMLYGPRIHEDKDDFVKWPLGIYYEDKNDDLSTSKFDLERHVQVANYVFIDGHTEGKMPEEFRSSNEDNPNNQWEERSWWGFGKTPTPW